MDDLEIIRLNSDYRPSLQAWKFHTARERFRYLIWGIKGGKTKAGAIEFVRGALSKPNSLNWAVAPTYQHVQVMEAEVMEVLYNLDIGDECRRLRGQNKVVILPNGAIIQFKSADAPDNLRGPNVDLLWIDESAFLKQEAWVILRGRIVARKAEVIMTTTPKGKGWLYNEVVLAGMPPDAPYGEFSDGNRWISHHPTWAFPWVAEEEIEDARNSMTAAQYQQEFGAMFTASSSQVFHGIEESLSSVPIPEEIPEQTVLGLDLAKHQDFCAVVIMDGNGRVRKTDRWTGLEWPQTKARIIQMAKENNSATIMDVSNVGSTIYDDLHNIITIHPVQMNSPGVKNELIECLQVAFEARSIHIINPNASWSSTTDAVLVKELQIYEVKTTHGARLSFSAPKGLHDDMVIALALANWGRARGLAVSVEASDVCLSRKDMDALRPDKDDEEIGRLMGRRFKRSERGALGRSVGGAIFGRNKRSGSVWGDS